MAVYFERGGGSWLDYVAPVVGQLLGGMINQGFEKDREIRAAKQAQETADADFARKQQERAGAMEMLGNMGFKLGADTPMDMRGDPNNAMGYLTALGLINPNAKFEEYMKYTIPNMQHQAINLGDKVVAGAFDPGTGESKMQDYNVGIDPAQISKQEAEMKYLGQQQKGNMDMARFNVANRPPRAAPQPRYDRVQDANGQYVYLAPGQAPYHTGVTGTPPKQQQAQGPSLKDMGSALGAFLDPHTGQPLPGYEGVVGEFRNQIVKSIGGGGTSGNQPPGGAVTPNVEAQIGNMMQQTGKSREEVVAYLRTKGLL